MPIQVNKAYSGSKLPGIGALLGNSVKLIKEHWKLYAKVFGVFAVIDLIFGSGATTISNALNNLSTSHGAFSSVGSLIGAGSNSSGTSTSALPNVLTFFEIILAIYLAKQLTGKNIPSVKDVYYRSMGQLVPLLLVLALAIVQLLPMAAGSLILVSVFSGSPGAFASIVFVIIFAGLSAWSIYMLSATIFALFAVSEPNAEPMKSIQLAKKMVNGKRWPVVVRLVALPVAIAIFEFLLLLIFTLVIKSIAALVFYLLGLCIFPFAAAYLYFLYEELAHAKHV